MIPAFANWLLLLFLHGGPSEGPSPQAFGRSGDDTTKIGKLDFTLDILPIVKAKCSPCHFQGGIKYIRVPLDDPQTIRKNAQEIIKFIDDPEAAEKVKQFVEQKEE